MTPQSPPPLCPLCNERPPQARIDEEYVCEKCAGPAYERWKECVDPEMRRLRLWLASFRLVRGGVEALR